MKKIVLFLISIFITLLSGSVVESNDKNFSNEIGESNKTVVMFFAPWCNACKEMKPVYKDLSNSFDGKVKFLLIDADKNDEVSKKYDVKNIPMTIVFENGKEVRRDVGSLDRIQIIALIDPKGEEKICDATDAKSMKECYRIANIYGYDKPFTKEFGKKAFRYFSKLCEHGNMEGCLEMGYSYYHAKWVEKNITKALELFDKSCKNGELNGCVSIGIAYRDGIHLPQSYKRATEIFKDACDKGSSFGCYHLARSYGYGRGVEQNITKALILQKKICDSNNGEYYSKYESCTHVGEIYKNIGNLSEAYRYNKLACERGSSPACNNLGLMYGNGEGVEKNASMAIKLFTMSCDGGNPIGCYNLGSTYQFGWYGAKRDTDKGIEYLLKSCDLGEMDGCFSMGYLYAKGDSVKRDFAKAVKYYNIAYNNNYVKSYYYLGNMYRYGLGVKINIKKARELYKKSCDNNDSLGCNALKDIKKEEELYVGYRYKNGLGLEKNCTKAKEIYTEVCENYEGRAKILGCNYLADLHYSAGCEEYRDYNKARKYFSMGCDAKFTVSCYYLSKIYYGGLGVEENKSLAGEFAKKACDYGSVDGCLNLGYLYLYGEGVKKDRGEAIKYLRIGCIGEKPTGCLLLADIYSDKNATEEERQLSKRLYEKAIELYTREVENNKHTFSSFANLLELLLVKRGRLDRDLEEKYLKLYKDSEPLIVYDMLKIFEDIYHGRKSKLEDWKRKYAKSGALKKQKFEFSTIKKWIDEVKDEKIRKELLKALYVFVNNKSYQN